VELFQTCYIIAWRVEDGADRSRELDREVIRLAVDWLWMRVQEENPQQGSTCYVVAVAEEGLLKGLLSKPIPVGEYHAELPGGGDLSVVDSEKYLPYDRAGKPPTQKTHVKALNSHYSVMMRGEGRRLRSGIGWLTEHSTSLSFFPPLFSNATLGFFCSNPHIQASPSPYLLCSLDHPSSRPCCPHCSPTITSSP